jgi:hypothetical protein
VVRAFKSGSAMEDELDAMTAQQGVTPQQIQAQQQQLQQHGQDLQKKSAEVAKREEAAKVAEHQAALKQKDLQNASDKLDADKKLFQLEQRMRGEMEGIVKDHAAQIQELGGHAENVVRDIIRQLPAHQPQAPVAEAEMGPKAKQPSQGIRDIHIHASGDGVKTTDGSKPKKPRRLRIVDGPDGSTIAEELLDEPDNVAAPAAPGA